ncbi:hypothetical protein DRO61_09140, partial [Candidatus Bathyarchaeota archaeon]
MDNTPYQDKVAKERINSLSKFMEDVQFRTTNEEEQKPYFRKKNKRAMSLDSLLENIEEADDELDVEVPVDEPDEVVDTPEGELDDVDGEETPETKAQGSNIHIGPRQRYFIGASNDPKLAIVSRDEGDRIYYYTYPFKKEQFLKREIFADLAETGSRTWMKNHKEESDTDLYMSIDSVLRGRPGERVSIDDFKFSNLQIKYIGKEKGDSIPWKDLEEKYNINVDSVLTNKQIYNVRLTNYDLNELEDKLDETPIDDRKFKIIKIVKEDIDYLLEAAKGTLKPSKRELLTFELDSFKKYLQSNITEGERGGDFIAGETVRYKNDMYIVVDFQAIGDTLDDVLVTLVKPDFTEVIEPVKLTDLKKVAGHELTGKTKKDAEEKEKATELKFPESGEDGLTDDVMVYSSDSKPKNLKEETLNESSVSTLVKFINTDADLYKGRYTTVADNLKKKKESGIYDAKLGTQAFLDVAERGAKKYFGDRFKFSASDMLLKNTADALRKEWEKEAHLNEDDEVSLDNEALPFSDNELRVFKKYESYNQDAQNMVSYTWNSGEESGKNVKVTVTKKQRPQQKDTVYTSKSIYDNNDNLMDTGRTQDSAPFRTEEDLNVLETFISGLSLNEECGEVHEDDEDSGEETVDTTGIADIKGTEDSDVDENELAMGIEIEFEHTKDKDLAKQIALDHLSEIPDYYTKLKAMEAGSEGVDEALEDDVAGAVDNDNEIGKTDCEPYIRAEEKDSLKEADSNFFRDSYTNNALSSIRKIKKLQARGDLSPIEKLAQNPKTEMLAKIDEIMLN